MEISCEREGKVYVLVLRGRFDAPSAPEAERILRDYLNEGMNHVALDLTDVEYISSGGLRVVVMLTKALEKIEGQLKLCGLSPFVSEVFKITNLAKRYEIYQTRQDALAAFGATV